MKQKLEESYEQRKMHLIRFFLLSLVCMAYLSIFTMTAKAAGETGFVNKNSVILRKTASDTGKNVIQLTAYDHAEIVSNAGGWYCVKSFQGQKTYKGYLRNGDLTKLKGIASSLVGKKAYLIRNNVTLRDKAKSSGTVLTTLNKGEIVTVLKYSKGWFKAQIVRSNKTYTGYMLSNYAVFKNLSDSGNTVTLTNTEGYVSHWHLNLRESASASSRKIVELTQNDKLILKAYSNHWYKVTASHEGKIYEGYVFDEYVTIGKAPAAPVPLPVPEPKPDPTPTPSVDANESLGVVNSDILNLRESPTTASKSLLMLVKNDQLILKEYKDGWYKVSAIHDSKIYNGYVFGQYVSKPSIGNDTAVQITTAEKIGYVNYSYLNLRESSSASSKLVTVLSQNDTLVISAYNNNWYKVKAIHDGKIYNGYVLDTYVKLSK